MECANCFEIGFLFEYGRFPFTTATLFPGSSPSCPLERERREGKDPGNEVVPTDVNLAFVPPHLGKKLNFQGAIRYHSYFIVAGLQGSETKALHC